MSFDAYRTGYEIVERNSYGVRQVFVLDTADRNAVVKWSAEFRVRTLSLSGQKVVSFLGLGGLVWYSPRWFRLWLYTFPSVSPHLYFLSR